MEPVYKPGCFVWHELFTSDMEASKRFYSGLFGWQVKGMPMGPFEYQMILAGETPIAGYMDIRMISMPGVPPFWMSYVSVLDVAAAADAATKGGGKLLVPPTDIPPIGRMAVIQDPQGAVITAWRDNQGDRPDVMPPPAGTFCWDELNTSDPEAAKAFYTKVFGWTCASVPGMDGQTLFMRGDKMAATVGPAPGGVHPHWLNFVVVPDLATIPAKVEALGGKVLMPEIKVPGIGRFVVIADNVGAVIAPFEGEQQGW